MKKYIPILFLAFLIGVICGANYTPNTFLSGWDTLHPEFNLPLAFSRVLSGVWRSDQGLGTVAIQSHMAELPRLLYLWVTSLVLPVSMLRYSYFFLMLLAGPLGMYALVHTLFRNRSTAFVASLIYLCNLVTVQHFIVPLEMFAAQYGFLPWILLTIITILKKPSKKKYAILAVLSFFASAQGHTATLLYAYLAEITLILVIYTLFYRSAWKRTFGIFGILIATNLYIILPNIYAAVTHGMDVANSKVNQLFSPEAFAKGQLFGTPLNAINGKNFLFNWDLYNYEAHQFTPVTGPWAVFADNPVVVSTGYIVFALALVGVFLSIKKKQKMLLALIPLFFISFFMLNNGTAPVSAAFDLLGTIAPVAREALRFPFTKFSILYITGLSICAAYAVSHIKKQVIILVLSGVLLFSFTPAFSGNLISPSMRITIPQEYFTMFDWFATQPVDKRVAILPIHSFWNWTYYDWGYQGAGFLQFGIPQPILDRDYDRWSPYNEQYAKDMSYAVYSQNPENIKAILIKYNVSFVLVDRSILTPASNENQTLLWLMNDLLTRAGVTQTKTFGENITVYSVPDGLPSNNTLLNPYFPFVTRQERFTGSESGTLVTEITGRTYTSSDTSDIDHIALPDLNHAKNYILEITGKHTAGFPLQLCVSNNLTWHCDLTVHLNENQQSTTEQFLLPALSDFGFGYTLNFNNFTMSGRTSDNTIEQIRVIELPDIPVPDQIEAKDIPQKVERLLPTLYRVTITSPTDIIVLNQSFEKGWVALKNGTIIPNHILVNSWANGWTGNFGTSDIIYIMFWPQALEWIGFIL